MRIVPFKRTTTRRAPFADVSSPDTGFRAPTRSANTMSRSSILTPSLTKTTGEPAEEKHSFTYNYFYPPSTLNFHDLYSNSLALLSDEATGNTPLKDDDFHLNNEPSQSAPVTTPGYNNSSSDDRINGATNSTNNIAYSEDSIKVLPVKQRGVLDLLFPTSRVRGFKSVFDAFRKILSHTFR
ncbi:hypothetical protein K1T71_011745 [Dendrolimus kikuchii]|uniref:Uncharacterized protein n=1 Tax=Dendrolimus kikuchii TaxID=765133 RepID=A0ACC1CM09_9NEOP|nr:hypothetical protein K1T71_011745 [Dendrolimus kikuchii]